MNGQRIARLWVSALLAASGATPALAGSCQFAKVAELKVTMKGLEPIVETTVNGKPAPFLLDSGAFYSLIPQPVARALDLPLSAAPPGFQLRGIGGSVNTQVARVAHFGLAGADIPNVEFLVGGSDTGQTGLIGQNVLGLGDVEYDFPNGAVRLFRPKNCGKIAFAYWTEGKPFFEIPIQSKEEARNHTVGTVELDGAKLKATFDTGAERTVISLRAAARAGVKPGDPGVEQAGWSFGVGKRAQQGWIASFKLLRIGNEELHNVRLRMADMGDLDTDMLLGADYFVSHRVYVSNVQHRIYFTYTGGRLFDANAKLDTASGFSTQGAPAAGATLDAEGYARQGAMYQTQRDLPHAIEAYSQAVTLAPKDPRYLRQRALVYLAAGRPILAMDDLDASLALDPADTGTRLTRAEVRERAGNARGAMEDLDLVAGQLPREAMQRLRVAHLYTSLDAFDSAVGQYDLWLATHREDGSRADAQNGRCWALALANRDLKRARSDCDAAVRALPSNAAYLDSRALVAFREGDWAAALADLNAALAIRPRQAWTLYLRGVVEARMGQSETAAKDIAAATAIAPRVATRAAKYGIAPPPKS
ncbi:retroviral-like aspartic protease family protein [Sphingomonas azotifigens]|uniref:retroviral-like aspartic protease family protein n=1 Tax=Sphingomonas azotifigens TaxID=330920 RepID=UPI000A06E104|nr:retroviral-like aspartic protease family protein [Sphingomonas azotifigens]